MQNPLKMGMTALMITGALGVGSYALAASAAAPSSAEQMQAHHERMCTDRSARTTGHLAYLEAKLKPTTAQQAAWAKYRDAVAANAKTAEQNCLSRPIRSRADARPTIVERQAMMQKSLEMRLAGLKATTPALESLYGSLNADQKAVLDQDRSGNHKHSSRWRDGDRRGGMHKGDQMNRGNAEPVPSR